MAFVAVGPAVVVYIWKKSQSTKSLIGQNVIIQNSAVGYKSNTTTRRDKMATSIMLNEEATTKNFFFARKGRDVMLS